MRVVHLGTHDIVGGAARALHRLHLALRAEGVDSRMLVRSKSSADSTIDAAASSSAFAARCARWLRRKRMERQAAAIADARPRDQDGFHGDHGLFGPELIAQVHNADVVHLHWTQDFLDLPLLLPQLARAKPVVWTLHDQHGLTGGCHYTKGCDRWLHGCPRCPQFTNSPDSPLAGQIWRRMNAAVATAPAGRLHMVTASTWMGGLVRQSPRFSKRPVTCIPYGLDTGIFKPRDRRFARDILGLPQNAKIVLFVSDATGNPRKGLHVLAGAITQIQDHFPDLQLASIGQGQPAGLEKIRAAHRHLGAFDDDRWLSLAYSAADVFVIPSLEEAYGQTMLESLACGTLAIGSDTGGIPDLITDGNNGHLFPPGDATALARCLTEVLTAPERAGELGANGRVHVEQKHSLRAYAQAHRELYQSHIR